MGLRVNTNAASINAQRNLANVTEKLGGKAFSSTGWANRLCNPCRQRSD